MISIDEMCGKIRAAVDARTDPNFLIVARTDAYGEEAVERLNPYAEAGADMVKPIPHDRAELEYFPKHLKAPIHLGFTPGRITDGLTAWDAGEMGYKIVTFPMTALFASVKAMMDTLTELHRVGRDDAMLDKFCSFDDYFKLVGADFFRGMDEKYLKG